MSGKLSPLARLPAEDDWKEPGDLAPDRNTPGLYVLLRAGVVQYVGISADIYRRIVEHQLAGQKQFDDFRWIACACPHERLRLEGLLILAHLPPNNRRLALGIGAGRVWQLPASAYEAGVRQGPTRTVARSPGDAEAEAARNAARSPRPVRPRPRRRRPGGGN